MARREGSRGFLKGSGVDTGRRRFFIAGSSLTAAALIASVPFVDSVPVLLGMIAVAIGCIATNTSQVFALTNDLLPDARHIGKAMGFEIAAAVSSRDDNVIPSLQANGRGLNPDVDVLPRRGLLCAHDRDGSVQRMGGSCRVG